MPYDIVFPSAARTAATASSPALTIAAASYIRAELDVTASSAPTTLDVKIEHSNDGGGTWKTLKAFTQVGAVGTAFQSLEILPPCSGVVRATYTVVGTNYTFSVTLRHHPVAL